MLRPFFAELRLGSATLAIDDPANPWHCRLPVSARQWLVRLSIRDLDAAVRSAVSRVQLRCTDSAPFTCHLDEMNAVRDEMIGDVDAALVDRLGHLTLNGKAAPAVLHPANGTLNQTRPYIEITHFDVVFAGERTPTTDVRMDFSSDGYSVRGPHVAYDLYYEIACVADDRVSQRMSNVVRTLDRAGTCSSTAMRCRRRGRRSSRERIGGERTDGFPHYKIAARRDGSARGDAPGCTVSVEPEPENCGPGRNRRQAQAREEDMA